MNLYQVNMGLRPWYWVDLGGFPEEVLKRCSRLKLSYDTQKTGLCHKEIVKIDP